AQRPAKQPYLLVRLAVAPLPLPQRPRLDAGTHGRLRQGQAPPPPLLRERRRLPAPLGLPPPARHLPLRAPPVPPGPLPAPPAAAGRACPPPLRLPGGRAPPPPLGRFFPAGPSASASCGWARRGSTRATSSRVRAASSSSRNASFCCSSSASRGSATGAAGR